MSILLKDEILKRAKSQEKILGDYFEEENIQSCSYDLRIGTIFKSDNNGEKKIYSNETNPDKNWNIEVKPSEIVTILTLEEVHLPVNITGTVFAMNHLSSTGFLILNPGHIDPGFKGPISICAINLSKSTIKLFYGKTIFTIIFEKLLKDAEPYKNKKDNGRKLNEQEFLRDKASGLSNSFFDLIKEDEYTPYLKNLINEVLKDKSYKYLKRIVNFLVALATILGGIYIFMPKQDNRNQQILKAKVDSLSSVINKMQLYIKTQDDSLKYLKGNQKKNQ